MKYNKSFLVTLGHNSSVIFYNGTSNPIGYEEERLTGIKSDSSYPMNAFLYVLSQLTADDIYGSNIFVSHWFDKFETQDFPQKYFNHEHFYTLVKSFSLNVICVNSQFTHHDAHAFSSKAFLENFYEKPADEDMHYLVVDGFGNNQEVISIYVDQKDGLTLLKRVYGYEHSLGLMYQYATSFCNMKENQDEYKFLGYEVKISELLNQNQIENIAIMAYYKSVTWMRECIIANTFKKDASDELININDLHSMKENLYTSLYQICDEVACELQRPLTVEEQRTLVGFYVQMTLEQCVLRILKRFNIKNVCLSGGCFLNVKLNKLILDNVSGKVCVNPLSGDQGAAIGLYRKYTKYKFDFTDLFWGSRKMLSNDLHKLKQCDTEGVFIVDDKYKYIELITQFLKEDLIVNTMQGDMEFGPRALCNTTTLARPLLENVKYINKVNNRNEVMPMAPVMMKSAAEFMLSKKDLDRVIGSNKFMIITHDIMPTNINEVRGIAHTNVNKEGYTCRPQVIDDGHSIIAAILRRVSTPCLVNTSFNYHGSPILFSYEDAIRDYKKQKLNDSDNRVVLVILTNN